MRITGRGGVSVEDLWSTDGCRAHVSGSMIPELPHFFMLYGPNTNPAAAGGIFNHEEMVTRFALECIAKLSIDGKQAVEVTDDAFRLYNAKLEQRERLNICTDSPRAELPHEQVGAILGHVSVRPERALADAVRGSAIKVFCFFSSEKKAFLPTFRDQRLLV